MFLQKITILITILIFINTLFSAPKDGSDYVSVELIPLTNGIAPNQSFYLATKFKIDKKWHLYWKNPGDAGLPPSVEWNLPKGFITSNYIFPTPKKLVESEILSFVYDRELYLLTEIKAPEEIPNSIEIGAKIDWLVCKDICLPGKGEAKLSLPKVNSIESSEEQKTLLDGIKSKLPLELDLNFKAETDGKKIILKFESEKDFSELEFYPENGELLDYEFEEKITQDGKIYEVEFKRSEYNDKLPKNFKGLLFSKDSKKAISVNIELVLED
ncbi:MAG: hypothetical protein DWQ06_14060 [Calditrichaeota bacterium]|nr:MAG: hypothetical protein DWQ06_14060 [Calditrichota bacterium]